MKTGMKRALKTLGGIAAGLLATGAIYVMVQTSRFDASLDKVYDVPVPDVVASKDPAVIERGKHVVDAMAGCSSKACHGADLGGGVVTPLGPLGTLVAPNITSGNLGAAYSDGELAGSCVRHQEGRPVLRLMPAGEMSWFPPDDVVAVVSYLRTVPPVERENQPMVIKTLGKILDRQDKIDLDVARRIDHTKVETPPAPAATAEYGSFLTRACSGCHGEHFSGGPLPGAPPSLPVPLNLTPDPTGLKDWTFDDFEKLMRTGVRKNGGSSTPSCRSSRGATSTTSRCTRIWAYLRTVPPMPWGSR